MQTVVTMPKRLLSVMHEFTWLSREVNESRLPTRYVKLDLVPTPEGDAVSMAVLTATDMHCLGVAKLVPGQEYGPKYGPKFLFKRDTRPHTMEMPFRVTVPDPGAMGSFLIPVHQLTPLLSYGQKSDDITCVFEKDQHTYTTTSGLALVVEPYNDPKHRFPDTTRVTGKSYQVSTLSEISINAHLFLKLHHVFNLMVSQTKGKLTFRFTGALDPVLVEPAGLGEWLTAYFMPMKTV